MAPTDPDTLRNVALVGHQGSGKTTLAEALLFVSGKIGRPGSVPEGTTTSDYHPAEQERSMSIFTSLLHTTWDGHKVNLLDTPGYPDLASEVISGMTVADTALSVIDARSGIEVGTETTWTYAEQMDVPSVLVVNRIDQASTAFDTIVEDLKDQFGAGATVLQMPVSDAPRTVVDVLRMRQLHVPEGAAEAEVQDIDDAVAAKAQEHHETLVEDIAAQDEALMETYFEQGDLTETQLRNGLRAALVNRDLFPIFATSATDAVGVSGLLSFIDAVCPSPTDRPTELDNGDELRPDPEDEPVAFVFNTKEQEHVGEYSFVRVHSGTLESGQDLENVSTGATERIGQMYVLNGEDRNTVPRLSAGDIGALVKLDDTGTNDTLRSPQLSGTDVVVPPVQFPEPRYRAAVEPKESGQEDRLAQGLHQITSEDPSLSFEHDALLNQLILSGQGEIHLQIAKNRLRRRAGVEVDFVPPRISYREMVKHRARASYRHKKQSGGAGEFADISMLVEPLDGDFAPPDDIDVRGEETIETEWNAKVHFVDAIVGGVIDMNKFFSSIQKGVLSVMEEGPVAGFPVGDIRVVIYDGGMHPVDSNEAAFKRAAFECFRQAFDQARPTLLEPIHELRVTTPEEYTGDVISDLNGRRGRVQGFEPQGSVQRIQAEVPEAELHKYAMRLRSLTQGRGLHKTQFSHYEEMPAEEQEAVIEDAMAESAA